MECSKLLKFKLGSTEHKGAGAGQTGHSAGQTGQFRKNPVLQTRMFELFQCDGKM